MKQLTEFEIHCVGQGYLRLNQNNNWLYKQGNRGFAVPRDRCEDNRNSR